MTDNRNKKGSHRRTKSRDGGRRWLYLIPVILWMAVIFYMSSRTGEDSSAVSNPVTEEVVEITQTVRNDTAPVRDRMKAVVEVMVRKGAHMTEFGILFALVLLAVKKLGNEMGTAFAVVLTFAITFAYACSDELHQLFVSERAGRATDVMIDMCGAVIAFLIIQGMKTTRGRIVTGFAAAILLTALALFLMLWNF